MPKVSKETATQVDDFGVAIDRHSSLPGGRCPCPHWGYVLKGRLVVRYEDREETIEAGDAFYMPPGHAPEAEEGTEIVQFSPAEELAAMVAALKGSMQPED